MEKKHLKVALVQQSNTADRDANLAQSIKGIKEAAKQGAKLVVLQELHRGLYFCLEENLNAFDQAESIPGPTTEILGKLAKELEIVIVASIFERRGAGVYHNTAVAIERDGEILGIYRKMHIPHDTFYQEKFYFTPGDTGFEPIISSVGSLGILICFDQWFPEAARLMALAGADILIYPTAIGWNSKDDIAEQARQRDAWITVQRGHSVANALPVISCNRVGFEPLPHDSKKGINFWGSSFITGAQGEFLAEASTDKAEVLLAEIDFNRSEYIRRAWTYFRDRRIDEYAGLLELYL